MAGPVRAKWPRGSSGQVSGGQEYPLVERASGTSMDRTGAEPSLAVDAFTALRFPWAATATATLETYRVMLDRS